jgi:transcriptional regulator GlxA family with amidase domain
MSLQTDPAAATLEAMTRSVALLAVHDAQILDVTGPLEVFSSAERELARRRRLGGPRAPASPGPAYQLLLVAPRRGRLATTSGLELVAPRALSDLRGRLDTFLVAGGRGVQAALRDRALVAGVRRVARRARRVGSVCTGAYLLAEAGLLDGRRVTTHWASCQDLAQRYPRLTVEPDPIFVRDGSVITSAGVTAGMDLALALVEEDHGRELALAVARRLVMFLKRPGGQSQFSVALEAQASTRQPVPDLQVFIAAHPGADLSVAALARRAGMSPRNFARVFARETGTTPARFVERARIEAARRQLEDGGEGLAGVAAACGFGSVETLRRSFLRRLRVGPAEYRHRFQRSGRPAAAEGEP